ncbi:enolase C-terminal domain-like protein [Planomonospora parontospora]|uniref:enolase C-terminal domain-like protein n=1 Tax=Planomonospora parontospora TaxID=58119 RepID=UPI001670B06A|nr:enolase C-terminal domain-like protein [Planomonospora parontospora]GGL12536.1 o-succinylbenzoate synthase [Planomonospora parontospora subsp. antibiotica]GII14023.1 o-succinylbenzoate synthase [Planomonospora parontospora subsp. antibiotica]
MPRVCELEVYRLVLPYGRRPESVLVRLTDYGGMTGWGEVVDPGPGTWPVLVERLARELVGVDWEHPDELGEIPGGPAADMACWDLWARMRGVPLAHALGGSRTSLTATVRIGAERNLESLVARVNRHVCAGYAHITMDVHPGWDIEPLRAVRQAYPALGIGLDARSAYTDVDALEALDAYAPSVIERPFTNLSDHADLQERVAAPVLLEVSSERELDEAIAAGAGRALLIRPAVLGSLRGVRRVHDGAVAAGWEIACAGGQGTGLARAATVAAASLPGCSLPCDVAEPPRSAQIVTPPVGASGGVVAVPLTQPGLGHTIDEERVRRLAKQSHRV